MHPPDDANPPAGPQDAWPRCPGCGARRLTRCPFCDTAGTAFREPDPGTLGRHSCLVICPTCDEPFPPEYARRCEWCGRGFADGFEPEESIWNRIDPRVLAIVVTLVALGVAIVVYFAMFS